MKTKFEGIANMTVIVVALAVSGVVLTRYAASFRAPRSASGNLPSVWTASRLAKRNTPYPPST